MTPSETVELVDYVRVMCPSQRFPDETPDVWHDALRSLPLPACRSAVAALATRQRFVAPSEIHAEVRVMRSAVAVPSLGGGPLERRCPWPWCRCTHDGLCFKGWIEDGARVRACPQCRPEVAQHLERGPDDKEHRALLRTLPRPSRKPASTEGF